jgi:hydroxypyruvate isomerase
VKQSWLFEKINKIDKPSAKLVKMKRKKAQINKIRDENVDVTTDTTETQVIIRKYFEKLHSKKKKKGKSERNR